jgi:hypothetical protein
MYAIDVTRQRIASLALRTRRACFDSTFWRLGCDSLPASSRFASSRRRHTDSVSR